MHNDCCWVINVLEHHRINVGHLKTGTKRFHMTGSVHYHSLVQLTNNYSSCDNDLHVVSDNNIMIAHLMT